MKNWNGSIGPGRQDGIVLPVAVLLLVVLTIIAVASMRGTTMQERMAVGQIQMHSSFLLSEQLVWDAAECIRSEYIDGTGQFKAPPEPSAVKAKCEEDGAVIAFDEVEPWHYTVIANSALRDTGAVRPVVLEVITPGGGRPSLPRLAPYACFGSNCALTTAPSAASPTADGQNRLSPDVGDRCRIQGRHRPDDAETGAVPGVIMPDGELIVDGNPNDLGIEGDPPLVNDTHPDGVKWTESPLYDSNIVADINDTIDAYLPGSVKPDDPLTDFEPGDDPTTVWYAGPGDTITIDGGESTVFGVIILDGGRLEMQGNQCFVGAVLFRNGGEMVAMSGTPAVVGSVIGVAPDTPEGEDATVINPSLNGNPSFYYSDRALEIAEFISGSDRFDVFRWRAPIDLTAFDL